nr:integrase, catalytic region, zinc finger, CCHC-type, peptidase aspartic, catalytic [Tanacetum cinerariifolium]
MIPEPGDANREVNVTKTFHMQTDDELSEKELKQIEADDQAIQTILLGLPEDIYATVDSYKTAQEIWLRLMNDLKRNKHFPEKIASNLKFLNNLQPEWSRHVTIVNQTKDLHTADYTQLYDFLKYNQKEVDELKAERLAKTQDPLALMANSNNPYDFQAPHQDQSSFNQNYLQQPMPNPEDITDPTTAMNMAVALMAKAFKLNYLPPTNNSQRISSNPRNMHIAQPGMNMGQDRQMHMVGGNGGNQFRQYAGQNVKNPAGYNDVIEINMGQDRQMQMVGGNGGNQLGRNENQNQIGNGNLVVARAEGNVVGQYGNHIRCYNCRGVEEYDLMAAAADLDENKEVNENCILMANMQQASTSGTQTDRAPVYDLDGSAKVHDYENCDDNEIFNMFTQEEQYTELLEPIPEQHQVPQNDINVISEVGETHALSKPVTSNSVSTPQESKGVNNDKFMGTVRFGNDHVAAIMGFGYLQWGNILITRVYFVEGLGHNLFSVGKFCDSDLEVAFRRNAFFVIAPVMFRINPDKTSWEAKKMPNTVSASNRTKQITVSQPPVITKKDVNCDLNGLSSTGIDNTMTRRPQPRNNTKHDRVPSASKSSRSKN